MKKLTIILFICGSSFSAFAQSPAKKQKIQQVLDAMGSGKMGVQAAKSMIEMFKKSYPSVDPKIWDEFMNEMKADELIELIVPIYDKYYTEDDLDQMIAFYGSPVGKKITESTPKISQESMAAGQAWGVKIGEKIQKKLKEKGY